MEINKIIETVVHALDKKKAKDIQVIDISDLSILGDYLIIAGGNSTTQVKALADEVDYELAEKGIQPDHIEGRATGWILLDYGGVLVHIFTGETRDYYNLERLWSDANDLDISDIITEN